MTDLIHKPYKPQFQADYEVVSRCPLCGAPIYGPKRFLALVDWSGTVASTCTGIIRSVRPGENDIEIMRTCKCFNELLARVTADKERIIANFRAGLGQ